MACPFAYVSTPAPGWRAGFTAHRSYPCSRRGRYNRPTRPRQYTDWQAAIGPLRDAIRPFDGAAEVFRDRGNGSDDWNPSRLRSIEEVPIALGFLVVSGGDFDQGTFGGANYGRDCDSIAGMVAAISGALHGVQALRPQWVSQVQVANRTDFTRLASGLTDLVLTLQQRQLQEVQRKAEAFRDLRRQV